MATIVIEEKGCRDCSLCVDICPTKVLERDEPAALARVVRVDDCIGCTSCECICPSRCITVSDIAVQKPFFRIEQNSAIVEHLLQKAPARKQLTEAELRAALIDIGFRLRALSDSVTETMGRGQRAVGRKAGALAAEHLPEMYEGASVREVLAKMQKRFEGSFDFEPKVQADGAEITMVFPHCGMHLVVEQAGGKVGDHVLCQLFHEYWAGLLGAFLGKSYSIEMPEVGARCTMKLAIRN
jgi:NAD-dependent dihydropyrimidine dehydrogenase PreA subunit